MVRPDDKLEFSPTGRATCRICKTKIAKGSVRAGIHYLHEGINWYCKYYHKDCLKTTSQGISLWKKAKLPPEMLLKQKGGNDLSRMNLLDLGVSKIEKKKRVSDSTIRERKVLRETLRLLRRDIARRLHHEPYKVFHNSTLDALVLQLPSTKAELLKISGFGLKKTATLGPCILPIIQGYKRKQLTSPTTRTNSKSSSSNYGAVPSLDDEEIEVVGEVSNEQLIDQVFEEAEKLGNVISL
mmetsp:Transcript_10914/g.26386  ORF Transcript_10914/g.26386 Transcript_10914/m.26386 type:complete len:240 (+) Transcript_10914:112-831(+)